MAKLVVGCGYLGRRVADRWLAQGQTVYGATRSPEHAEGLRRQGVRSIVADVTRPESLRGLPEAETVLFAVAYDPQSGLSRQEVQVDGLRNVLDALPDSVRRVIFISSTGVYSQTGGDWVDEDSSCQPTREAGRVLLAAESVLRSHRLGSQGVVLRLAGLYGPGRITRLADLLAGRPIVAPSEGHLNLIHVDDAVTAVLAADAYPCAPTMFLVSDGHPVLRAEFYAYLASLLGREPPTFVAPAPESRHALRSSADKRIRNHRLLNELRIQLAYPSYREGLAAVVRG